MGNNIDNVSNINNAESCQEQCQKLSGCEFWTYDSYDKSCYRHNANAPNSIGTGTSACNTCTRGPKFC